MKRTALLPASLLLLLIYAACTTAPTNTANTNAANSNAANSNARAAAPWTNDDVIAAERAAWDAIKRKDYAAFSDMLAPEFIDVTSEGVYDKARSVEAIKTFEVTDATLSDFKVLKINDTAAVVTYAASVKGASGGQPIPADNKAYHSTAVVWRGGKWHAVYHQVSDHMEEPPLPPAPKTAAATSPSPAASAASTPAAASADAEANEKLIWDALKRKDWNAFASYLADDQIEVWNTGVNNKAQSVEGVKQVDFSTFTLSDFKTIALDADAKLVTYTVKGTGPDGKPFTDYSSSIWASRGGKWLAVFHQGTLATPPTR